MIDITKLLPEESLIIAAVSGGPDSVYLLFQLKELAEKNNLRLTVGHVNHKTRGAASDEDEAFVRDLAERLSITYHIDRLELDAPGTRKNEQRMRLLRLGALKALGRRLNAAAIVFGHHRDDMAETFLLNALRGSGPAGLEGMRPVRQLPDGLLLLRPLLDTRRAEIEKWLEDKGEAWRVDETNSDLAFRRNRIRHEVLPLLEAIEPAAAANLANSAEFSGEVYDVYTSDVGKIARKSVLAESGGTVLFSVDQIKRSATEGQAAGLVRYFYRQAVLRSEDQVPIVPNRDTLRNAVRRLYSTDRMEAHFQLGNHITLSLTNRYGLVYPEDRYQESALAVSSGFPFAITPHGTNTEWKLTELDADDIPIYLPGWSYDYQITTSPRTFSPAEYANIAPTDPAAYIDFDACEGSLQLRSIRPGERVQLHDGGTKMVRTCLQEAGVPPRLRALGLGFTDSEGILWMPGVRRSAKAWITEATKRVMEIRQVAKRNPA